MIVTSLGQKIVVRYARKPLWMPTAPSKLFNIAEHTFYSPEEIKLIRQLDETHKAQELSIREYMRLEFYEPAKQSGGIPDEFTKLEREQEKAIYAENDRENARIAQVKTEYFNKKLKEMEEKVMEEKLKREEEAIVNTQRVAEYIQDKKSNPDFFVTPENIERKIDEAMEKTTNYEFFIDTAGRRYYPKGQK